VYDFGKFAELMAPFPNHHEETKYPSYLIQVTTLRVSFMGRKTPERDKKAIITKTNPCSFS
jgi:hypothetical protein